jgi:hypothetical protein
MKLIAFGTEPVGVIAIGASATGVIAIGALATGVVAIGQLARGGIVAGQLALGLVSIGQLSIGAGWSSGQLGIAATSGPGIVLGLFGRLYLWRLLDRKAEVRWERPHRRTRKSLAIRATLLVALIVLWWLAAGQPLMDAFTRVGGVFVDAPRPLR